MTRSGIAAYFGLFLAVLALFAAILALHQTQKARSELRSVVSALKNRSK